MPFEQNGEIKIHVIPKPDHSYDFQVIKGVSDVLFRGSPASPLNWSTAVAAKIELRDENGDMQVAPSILRNIFTLKSTSRDGKKGTLTLEEAKLRNVGATNKHEYDRIMECFERCGTLFVSVTTTGSSETYPLDTHLLDDPISFTNATDPGLAAAVNS